MSDPTFTTKGTASERRPRHLGAGMNLVPELAVMEALVLGMQLLAEDPDAAAECVDRLDAMAHHDPEDWRRGLIDELKRMLTPGNDSSLNIFVGFDAAVANMPAIHLENAGGGENTAEAEVGDLIGEFYTLRNQVDVVTDDLLDTEHLAVQHQVNGVGQTTQVVIGCWDPAPERALLIQAAARWALFAMRGHLQTRGVHEFSWSESAIVPSGDMDPRPTSYVPTLTLTLHWTFRATESKIVPNRFRVTTRFTT